MANSNLLHAERPRRKLHSDATCARLGQIRPCSGQSNWADTQTGTCAWKHNTGHGALFLRLLPSIAGTSGPGHRLQTPADAVDHRGARSASRASTCPLRRKAGPDLPCRVGMGIVTAAYHVRCATSRMIDHAQSHDCVCMRPAQGCPVASTNVSPTRPTAHRTHSRAWWRLAGEPAALVAAIHPSADGISRNVGEPLPARRPRRSGRRGRRSGRGRRGGTWHSWPR